MSGDPYLDPLEAANNLLTFIEREAGDPRDLIELANRIDALIYALRFLLVDSVAYIQQTDEEPPSQVDRGIREQIGKRFELLGPYWTGFFSRLEPKEGDEITASDAINDLADIAKELKEVQWYFRQHGRDEALAALRFRYEHHLWMHIVPLRGHLEALKHWG